MSAIINLNIKMDIENLLRNQVESFKHPKISPLTIKNFLSSNASFVKETFNSNHDDLSNLANLTRFLCNLDIFLKADEQILEETLDVILHHLKVDEGSLMSLLNLHEVAKVNAVRVCCLYVKNGARVDQPQSDEITLKPLHLAIRYGSYATAKKLIELGASVNDIALDIVDNIFIKTTPLKEAILKDRDLVELLCKQGVMLNQACDHEFPTPLHCALSLEKFDLIPLLLKYGFNATSKSLEHTIFAKIAYYSSENINDVEKVAFYVNTLRGLLGLTWEDFNLKAYEDDFVFIQRCTKLKEIHVYNDWIIQEHTDTYETLILITNLLKEIGANNGQR